MHLITQCKALVTILSRAGTVGFRFLMADVAGTSVVAAKILHVIYANHSPRHFDRGMIS